MQSKTFSLNAQKSTSVNICSFYLTLSLNVRYQIMSLNKLHIDRRFEVQMKFYVPHLSMASLCPLSFNVTVSAVIFRLHQQHPIHPTFSHRGTKLCVIRLRRERRRDTVTRPQLIGFYSRLSLSGPDVECRCAAVRLLLQPKR